MLAKEDPAPVLPPSAARLATTPQLHALLTIVRNKETPRSDFIFYSDRIIRLLVEEGRSQKITHRKGLNHLPVLEETVETPTGQPYTGVAFRGRICGVSILRAGEAMESGLRECCRSVRIGKILIQRVCDALLLTQDEETAKPKLFYAKLPEDIRDRWVLLLDPMLATGGSAIQAIKVLLDHGVHADRILFLNMIASPEGLQSVYNAYPQVRIISAWVDAKLSDQSYILPGLGDYGDRYYSG
ncbi:uracil phosphoribosyltransferase [Malassezia yamatoensis]|uniref:uracil phosphoribosyltransferase n=1 Tax=Malassezia yamatoensis TaxID=253288 RepID=A0AAJ5YTW6_9BASI|nr:uracil phosphoribosyltransferase [Malassezia yamatoensis]